MNHHTVFFFSFLFLSLLLCYILTPQKRILSVFINDSQKYLESSVGWNFRMHLKCTISDTLKLLNGHVQLLSVSVLHCITCQTKKLETQVSDPELTSTERAVQWEFVLKQSWSSCCSRENAWQRFWQIYFFVCVSNSIWDEETATGCLCLGI